MYTCLSDNPEYIRYRSNVENKTGRTLNKTISYTHSLFPDKYSFEKEVWGADPATRYWDYVDLKIYKDSKLLATVKKNYHGIDFCYANQNGVDYLITSEDYQAITIVNLETGEIKTYGDWERIKKGWGFCPVYYDWDEDTLLIEGCYWACPYENMKTYIPDLNNPDFDTAEYWDCDPEEEDDDDDFDD